MTLIAFVMVALCAAPGVGAPAKGEWPMPAHDSARSACAEVACSMADAPHVIWSYDLGRQEDGAPFVAGAVVADVMRDERNEVIVPVAGEEVVVLRAPGAPGEAPEELWRTDGWGFPASYAYGPTAIAVDIDQSGKSKLLVACAAANGSAGLKLLDRQGVELWRQALAGEADPVPAEALGPVALGHFNGDGQLDAFLTARATEGVWHAVTVDLRDGTIHWHNRADADAIPGRSFSTQGLPSVANPDRDWFEDIWVMAGGLLVALSGQDGTLVDVALPVSSASVTAGPTTAMPLDLDEDGTPDALLQVASDSTPGHPGIADVDGDRAIEVGMLGADGTFRCLDGATGGVEWEVPGLTNVTDVTVADVDGDGRPEFVTGLAAVKAVEGGGAVLWEIDVPGGARSPAIADVDGDGLAEILVGCGDGRLRAYE